MSIRRGLSVLLLTLQCRKFLSTLKRGSPRPYTLNSSGNGEPTLNPHFPEIVEDVITLRDAYYPQAKVSVLTNSTRVFTPAVAKALKRVDNNILKLDSAVEETMRLIDQPNEKDFTVKKVVDGLKQFAGTGIIQTMFLRGEHEGKKIDNTTPEEVTALIEAYKEIRPREIMIYSLDRSTPEERLTKVPRIELEGIARLIETATSIPVQVN